MKNSRFSVFKLEFKKKKNLKISEEEIKFQSMTNKKNRYMSTRNKI